MSDDLVLAALARLETNLARVETNLARVETNLAGVDTNLAGVETRLARVETNLAGVDTRLAGVEIKLARLETNQARFETNLASLETGQEALRTDFFTELGKVRGQIMEKVEGLQDSFTTLRDDIAVNFGAVDQVRRANTNTRDELHGVNDVVTRIMTVVLRLQADVDELKRKDK